MSSTPKPSFQAVSYPVRVQPRDFEAEARPEGGGTECFDTAAALELNRARLDHLASLGLSWAGKSVLDVGCGVGHFSQAVAQNGCRVVGVDAREENIRVFRERHPHIEARVANVEQDLSALGTFDVVLCYGLLYHLENPCQALRNLAAVCRDLLIVETIVCDHEQPVAVWDDETKSANQALMGLGCRPSPSLVTLAVNRIGFPLVYAPLDPPRHAEFEVKWTNSLAWIQNGHVIRAVFLASRTPLENPRLELLCGTPPAEPRRQFSRGDEISGAVSLAERVLHNATEARGETPLTIVSPPQSWAYCVAFPLHEKPLRQSGKGGPILIQADLQVQNGEARFAGANQALTEFVGGEAVVTAEEGRREIELVIESPEDCAWIVFRNGAAEGPSRFEIHGLKAYEARESLPEPADGKPHTTERLC